MNTLHIEHPISDFAVWSGAFARFEDARRKAGVRSYRVSQPVDDQKFVVIDLDFDTASAAESFRNFLTASVWANKENSPGLDGTPQTRILTLATTA